MSINFTRQDYMPIEEPTSTCNVKQAVVGGGCICTGIACFFVSLRFIGSGCEDGTSGPALIALTAFGLVYSASIIGCASYSMIQKPKGMCDLICRGIYFMIGAGWTTMNIAALVLHARECA